MNVHSGLFVAGMTILSLAKIHMSLINELLLCIR